MKEIGGYFGLEQLSGTPLYSQLIPVANGRSALGYLLKARQIQKLYLPHFLCSSVADFCQREGCPVEFYSIGKNLLPLFQKELADGEYLYVVNYYGQLTDARIRELKTRYDRLILDNVQAFFHCPVPGVDTLYSCRKFFGVPDGGYLATDAVLSQPLPADRSMDRMRHILGRFEGCASDYYADFKASDHAFLEMEARQMSPLTQNLLRAIDYAWVKKQREENYAVLTNALQKCNSLQPITPEGPYCYPFYCPGGMELKKRLAEHKIYIATLWPNVLTMEDSVEKDLAENILPLPCDQRYTREDMEFIIQTLTEYMP